MARRLAEAFAIAVAFALLAIYCGRQIWDTDVFWHIVAGRTTLETGHIIDHDTFSALHPERPWLPLEWGYEVLVALLDRAGGPAWVRALHAGVQFVAFVILFVITRRRFGFSPVHALAALELTVVLYADRFRERAHVFNLLFEIVLLPQLLGRPDRFGRGAFVVAALVMAAWANLHAGGALVFLIVALAVPIAAAIEGVDPERRAWRPALIWYACLLLPALLSPNFLAANLHELTVLDNTEIGIPEWYPSWRYFEVGKIPAHFFAGAFPTLLLAIWALPVSKLASAAQAGRAALARFLARVPIVNIGVALAFLVLAHRAIRFTYLAGLAWIALWPCLVRVSSLGSIAPRVRSAIAAAGFVGLLALGYQSRIMFIYGDLANAARTVLGPDPIDRRKYPIEEAAFLAKTGFQGSIFCGPRWGGYLLWALWPHARVLSDARQNYSEELMIDLGTVMNPKNLDRPENGPELEAIYAKYPIDLIVAPRPAWPRDFAPDRRRWAFVFSSPRGEVWVRNTPAGERYLRSLAATQSSTTAR